MSDFAFIIKEKSRTLNIMNHATAHKSEQSVCFTNQNSVHSLHTVALGVYSQSREISVEQIRKESEDGLEVLFQEDVGRYDMKQGPGWVALCTFHKFSLERHFPLVRNQQFCSFAPQLGLHRKPAGWAQLWPWLFTEGGCNEERRNAHICLQVNTSHFVLSKLPTRPVRVFY